MAKTIKFNLILNEVPVRDIKGLQNNFSIDEVLELYKNGLLQKWLEVRSFNKYLEKVNKIKQNESIIMQLIKIFDIEKSEKEIMENIYSLEFWEERKQEIDMWNKKDNTIKNIITDYHNGYEVLKGKIIENKENMPFLKAAVKEIADKYYQLFKLNYKDFFYNYEDHVPLIIYAILMHKELRTFFLNDESINLELSNSFLLKSFSDAKSNFYSKFDSYKQENDKENSSASKLDNIIEKIQNKCSIHVFNGETGDFFKTLEEEPTKVMILNIPNNTFIASPKNIKKEYTHEDVNGKFLILDGLLYKSKVHSSIVYMEV